MSLDLRTKTGIESWAALMMAATKVHMEQLGKMLPVAAVAITEEGESNYDFGHPVIIEAGLPVDEPAKERWLEAIRAKAHSGKAVAIMTIAEAIMVKVSIEEPQGVEQEVVAVDLEHRDLGNYSWVANIIRGDMGVKLTPFVERPQMTQHGRFSNLLKK